MYKMMLITTFLKIFKFHIIDIKNKNRNFGNKKTYKNEFSNFYFSNFQNFHTKFGCQIFHRMKIVILKIFIQKKLITG